MEEIKNQQCPMCAENTATLIEDERDIPHFGKIRLMSISCSSCKYHSADIESLETKDPCKIEFEVKDKKDLNIQVVKSAASTVKIPTLRMTLSPGPAASGFITTIEGLIFRFKKIVEQQRDSAEEPSERKSAKNLLKKIWKVECGDLPVKIVIDDPSGNSAIASDKAIITTKKKKK